MKEEHKQIEQSAYEKGYFAGFDKGESDGRFSEKNKTINTLVNRITDHCMNKLGFCCIAECPFFNDVCEIDKIAEQLKEGK